MFSYYRKKIYLPLVNKNGGIIGKGERWEIHRKGILHRGFTAVILYKSHVILQFRKHPVFDGVFDLSFSSHPYYKNNKLVDDIASIKESLKREWKVDVEENLKITFLGKVKYRSKDKKGLIENEIDYFYKLSLDQIPRINPDFAYGVTVIEKDRIKKGDFYPIPKSLLAPWVKAALKEKIFEKL